MNDKITIFQQLPDNPLLVDCKENRNIWQLVNISYTTSYNLQYVKPIPIINVSVTMQLYV